MSPTASTHPSMQSGSRATPLPTPGEKRESGPAATAVTPCRTRKWILPQNPRFPGPAQLPLKPETPKRWCSSEWGPAGPPESSSRGRGGVGRLSRAQLPTVPLLHTHLLYERFHDWPCCPGAGSLLRSPAVLLSPQLCRELPESMGRVSSFSHPPKGSGRSTAWQRGPREGCWLALAVMFPPERRTPRPTKPQLRLHEKLAGYKTQTHSDRRPLML